MKLKQIISLLAGLFLMLTACGGDTDSETSEDDDAGRPSATVDQAGGAAAGGPDSHFVRHLQEELNHLGFHAGDVDGVWGPHTMNAVEAFQEEHGLDVTGEYDEETATTLADLAGDADAYTVSALQQKLADLGFYDGTVDGAYGSGTEDAVLAYQEARDLDTTGTMTHETVVALTAEHDREVEQEHMDSARELGIGGVDDVVADDADGDTGSGDDGDSAEGSDASDDGGDGGTDTDDDGTLLKQGSEGPEVEQLQRRLAELGYRPGATDGRFGAATASAVLAFEKAEGIDRDGVAGPDVMARLENPQAAGPSGGGAGPRVEVDLDRQILFVIDGDGNVTTINVSTGSGRGYDVPGGGTATAYTPDGEFVIERSIDGPRQAALGTLYRPLYFKEGWAIHGSPHVPAYPASHGCVRTANWDQDFLWTILSEGDAVSVYGHNPGDASTGAAGA